MKEAPPRRHVGVLVAGAVLVLAVGSWWLAGSRTSPGGDTGAVDAAKSATGKPSNLPCEKVLGCAAGKAIEDASKQCRPQIEQLAVFAPRWTNRPGDTIFVDYLWHQEAKGTLTFQGKNAEFQDAGGTFGPVAYECDYDPAAKQVLNVRVTTAK